MEPLYEAVRHALTITVTSFDNDVWSATALGSYTFNRTYVFLVVQAVVTKPMSTKSDEPFSLALF